MTPDYRINKEHMEKVLDRLQQVYRFRLDLSVIPDIFKNAFYRAANRFYAEEIDEAKMGIAEEVGDIVYQSIKVIAVEKGILTPENQRALLDKFRTYLHSSELNINELYKKADSLIGDELVQDLSYFLPKKVFPSGDKITKEFLSNQLVSYVSRSMGDYNKSYGSFHTIDYIKAMRIPEETAELVSVLNYFSQKTSGIRLLNDTKENLELSSRLVSLVNGTMEKGSSFKELFAYLDELLKKKLRPDLSLDDVLRFCLFKIRGRQELTFKGYDHRSVMHICKPAEYLMEANLVMR